MMNQHQCMRVFAHLRLNRLTYFIACIVKWRRLATMTSGFGWTFVYFHWNEPSKLSFTLLSGENTIQPWGITSLNLRLFSHIHSAFVSIVSNTSNFNSDQWQSPLLDPFSCMVSWHLQGSDSLALKDRLTLIRSIECAARWAPTPWHWRTSDVGWMANKTWYTFGIKERKIFQCFSSNKKEMSFKNLQRQCI